MTIGGWIICIIFAIGALAVGVFIACTCEDSKGFQTLTIIIAMIIAIAIFVGGFAYFRCTESGKRSLTDQKSELGGGLDRTVTIYTANGDMIAQYVGKIDIESGNSYIKFDFEGKRYIYYNCFVETIADID